MISVLTGLLLGTGQGVRHAFEPDHLAAVSTVVAEQKSTRASMTFAATWGFGHALILTVVGGALFFARAEMPARLGECFELAVGVMLMALGARALSQAARRSRAHEHSHLHGAQDAAKASRWTLARRPLVIGLVHGLAGSGALATLVMAKLPSMAEGVVFMALYGTGAMIGMAMLAGIAGAPLARLARRPNGLRLMLGLSGTLSLGLGFFWGMTALVHVLPNALVLR